MVIVFDLDDTLYTELDYVRGAFKSVAEFLEDEFGIPSGLSTKQFISIMNCRGRGKVFDEFLTRKGIYSKKNVSRCLSVYRSHEPKLELPHISRRCLARFERESKYLVTDGNKLVQQKKIQALDIGKYFKDIFITHRYGTDKAKPSPYCFLKICEKENVTPSKVVYVGDNPKKDFVGLKPLGFKTIRIVKGAYKDLRLSSSFEAHIEISSLEELNRKLLRSLMES